MNEISGNGHPGTPAGWYPDAQGAMRWWDGSGWTDNVQGASSASQAPPLEGNPKANAKAARANAKASRPWYKKKRWWVAAAIVAIIAISAAAGGGGGGDKKEPAAGTSSPETTASKSADTQQSEKAEPKPKWKTVARLRGNTNKAGTDFHLNGCDTRMVYNVRGDESSTIVAFYVMESGKKLQEDGGFPVASPTKSGPGKTAIRQDEGDYYIETVAANADWQVQMQEKC